MMTSEEFKADEDNEPWRFAVEGIKKWQKEDFDSQFVGPHSDTADQGA